LERDREDNSGSPKTPRKIPEAFQEAPKTGENEGMRLILSISCGGDGRIKATWSEEDPPSN